MRGGADNIASGTLGEDRLNWVIDSEGKLTVEGTGDFSVVGKNNEVHAAWYEYRESITSAVINLTTVRETTGMFEGCTKLTSVDLRGLDTSNTVSMRWMFEGCHSLTDLDLSPLKTDNVENMRGMFEGCSSLTGLDLSPLKTGNVTNMSGMFGACSGLKTLDLSPLNTKNVTDMSYMFYSCSGLTSLDLSPLKTDKVYNMEGMFRYCSSLTEIDLRPLKTGNVYNMTDMFLGCYALKTLDLTPLDTSNVTDMQSMFSQCNFTELDLSPLKTGNVYNMAGMFSECFFLKSVDLSMLDLSSLTCARGMFSDCRELTDIDLSSLDAGNMEEMQLMFKNCNSLTNLKTPKNLSLSVDLPVTMSDSNGTTYNKLPTGKAESISLVRKSTNTQDPKMYTVTFDTQGHGGPVASASVKPGAKVSKPEAPVAEGYVFDGWYKESTCENAWNFDKDKVNSDITLYAKWLARRNITYMDGDVEMTGLDPVVYWEGTETALPSPTKTGFKFKGWYADKNLTGEPMESIPEDSRGDRILYAKWATAYAIRYFDGERELMLKPASYEEGVETGLAKVAEKEGYVFAGWYADPELTGDAVTKIPAGSTGVKSFFAKWRKDTGSVTPVDIDDTYYAEDDRLDLAELNCQISNIKSKVYDGKPYLPSVKVTVKINNKATTLTEGVDYRLVYKNNLNAGTGQVIVKGSGKYTGTAEPKEFKITQKPIGKLKVTVGGLKKDAAVDKIPLCLYDGGYLLEEGSDYTIEALPANLTAAKGKQNITVTAVENSNYKGERKVKITVYDVEKVLQDSDVSVVKTLMDYTGKALQCGVTVTYDGKPLDIAEYSVKYTNNKDAGTAYVTVTGKKGYGGCVVKTFEIGPATTGFRLKKQPTDVTYNGKAQKPKLTVTNADGQTLKAGKDYLLLYHNHLHVGEATITIKGLGNYSKVSDTQVHFNILPQKIAKASVKGTKKQLTVTYAKKVLVEGTDYTLEWGTEDKNKVSVTIKGKNDFADTVQKKVKVK